MADYVDLANRNLTNNFTGGKSMTNVISATADKFGMNIVNNGATPVNVAIIPGHYPIAAVLFNRVVFNSVYELRKDGIPVEFVAADGTTTSGEQSITCMPTRPEKTIAAFLNYIKTNPKGVAQISLRSPSGNVSVYQNTIQLQKTNPFNQPERIPISTDMFFSPMQYQDTRVDIDMLSAGLNLDDTLLMFITLPANATLGIDFVFTSQPFPYM